jgi:hypothetical protein
MNEVHLDVPDIAALTALADGIIPPDSRDAGAAGVHAGQVIAERVRRGVNGALYAEGLKIATGIAREKFGRAAGVLVAAEIHELLGALEKASPRFFRQLRADVCALYMSDPAVWQRIGFPGPSTDAGGYPDFDQPQSRHQS